MEEKLLNKIDELKEQMLSDMIDIVQIDSVESECQENAPFGIGVKNALDKALAISQKLGFTTTNIDDYIGYASTGQQEDYICAIGHLDVVPVGTGWKYPPFSGKIENGKIYARGILDNKGPIMACLYALYALKECGVKFNHEFRIIFGCDEETGFKDLEYYLTKEKPPIMGFTPDCKYPVVYGERGRLVVKISSEISQLQAFFDYLNTYFMNANPNGDRLGINYRDDEFGMLEMRGYHLEYHESEVSFKVTLSYPASITHESLLNKIKETAISFKVENVGHYYPVKFEKDSTMVKALQAAYETVTHLDGTPVTTTGGTYAKALKNIVPFGPSFPGQKGIGHQPNEWMNIEDLITNAKIYALAFYNLNNIKKK